MKAGSRGAQAGPMAAEAARLAVEAFEALADLRDAMVGIARMETTDEDIVRGPEGTHLPDLIVSHTGSIANEARLLLPRLNDALTTISVAQGHMAFCADKIAEES